MKSNFIFFFTNVYLVFYRVTVSDPMAPFIPDILEETDAKTIIKVIIWPVEQRNGPVRYSDLFLSITLLRLAV